MEWNRIKNIDRICYSNHNFYYPKEILADLLAKEIVVGFSDGYSIVMLEGGKYVGHCGDWAAVKEFLGGLVGYNIYFTQELDFYGLNIVKSGNKWRII